MRQQHDQLQSQATQSATLRSASQQEIDALRQSEAAARAALDSMGRQVATLQREKDDLQLQYAQAMDNAAHLELRIQDESQRVEELLQQQRRQQQRTDASATDMDTLKRELVAVREQAVAVQAELVSTQAQLSERQRQLEAATAQRDRAAAERIELQRRADALMGEAERGRQQAAEEMQRAGETARAALAERDRLAGELLRYSCLLGVRCKYVITDFICAQCAKQAGDAADGAVDHQAEPGVHTRRP